MGENKMTPPPTPPIHISSFLLSPKCEMYALDFQSVPAVSLVTQPRPDMTPGQFNKILRPEFAAVPTAHPLVIILTGGVP